MIYACAIDQILNVENQFLAVQFAQEKHHFQSSVKQCEEIKNIA